MQNANKGGFTTNPTVEIGTVVLGDLLYVSVALNGITQVAAAVSVTQIGLNPERLYTFGLTAAGTTGRRRRAWPSATSSCTSRRRPPFTGNLLSTSTSTDGTALVWVVQSSFLGHCGETTYYANYFTDPLLTQQVVLPPSTTAISGCQLSLDQTTTYMDAANRFVTPEFRYNVQCPLSSVTGTAEIQFVYDAATVLSNAAPITYTPGSSKRSPGNSPRASRGRDQLARRA